MILENANFNLNAKNYNFFLELFDKNFKDGNLTIKDSNIFFRDLNDEVLFINKIYKSEFFWDPNNLQNVLNYYNSGIEIIGIGILYSYVSPEVRDAYSDVQSAKADKDKNDTRIVRIIFFINSSFVNNKSIIAKISIDPNNI